MQSLGQGLMSRPKEDKLSRERFEYQKDQDSKAQARAIVEQSQQDWLFEQQKLAEQQVFRENERQNAERVGMRDTILRTSGLMPPMADGWHKKEMFSRTLPEVQYLAGIEKTNQAAKALGLKNQFTIPQDPSVMTTAANRQNMGLRPTGDVANAQWVNSLPKENRDDLIKTLEELKRSGGAGNFAPSSLQKLIDERESLINDRGLPEDHWLVQAYTDKIKGNDIDLPEMSQAEIDTIAAKVALDGKMPSLGRGKQSTKFRVQIIQSMARQALKSDPSGAYDPENPDQSPSDAALSMMLKQSDTKSIQAAMTLLEKQVGAMGSFVDNLNMQVDKVSELSKDLKTFDTRLLNVPLRMVRGRIVGSPLQAKYDMYLAEIESEIGKLSTGSAASIAELSQGAQEKWAKIHDKALSVEDMLSLLEETKHAANMRYESVNNQLEKTREKMRYRGNKTTDNDPLGIR